MAVVTSCFDLNDEDVSSGYPRLVVAIGSRLQSTPISQNALADYPIVLDRARSCRHGLALTTRGDKSHYAGVDGMSLAEISP